MIFWGGGAVASCPANTNGPLHVVCSGSDAEWDQQGLQFQKELFAVLCADLQRGGSERTVPGKCSIGHLCHDSPGSGHLVRQSFGLLAWTHVNLSVHTSFSF